MRTFVALWATQSLSVLGSGLSFFATTIYLSQVLYGLPEQKADLAVALSLNGIAFAVPTVFSAPLAGAWADRHDRKRTMLVADVLSGALALGTGVLIAAGALPLWLLLASTGGYALLGAYHQSAFFSSYALLVPERHLPRANGMMLSSHALSGVLSPALAAGLIALPGALQPGTPITAGVALAVLGDGVSFLLAAAALPLLRVPSPARADLSPAGGKRKSFWADVLEGGVYIWRRRPLLWLLGTFTVANFVASPLQVLQPLMVKFNLAGDSAAQGLTFEGALALVSTAGGVGAIVGGVLVSTWGGLPRGQRVYGVVVPMLLAAGAGMAYGLSGWLALSAAMVLLIDAMTPILNSHSQAIWQAQVPPELQGRVFAVRRVIAQCTWPLSTALAGLVAGALDPGLVLAALSGLMGVFCVAQIFNPYLRRVEDRDWLEALAAGARRPPPGGVARPPVAA